MKMVYVKETEKYGKGVFAGKYFKKEETIFEWKGDVIDYEDIADGSYEDGVVLQISTRKYLGPSGESGDFINHSCNPNAGLKELRGKMFLVSIRDIDENEEITFDYSTSMNEGHWEMECFCQNENCRKRIRDFKFLPEAQKLMYLKLGVVPDFVKKK